MTKHEKPPVGLAALSALAASFFDASEDCVKVVGLDGALLAMNANGVCLMEINDFEALRGQPWAQLWPEDQRPLIQVALEEARAGRGSRFAADCPTGAGTPKSWDVVVWPVLDESGRPTQLISISRDVTAEVQAEEQRVLFTRELAHRIKNTFAVVDGVIALSARSAGEASGFADTLRKRLTGLGRAISYMAPPEFTNGADIEARSIKGLLGVLLQPYGATDGPERQISVLGDDVKVGGEATTTLALIFNELATNALKYGALSTVTGQVVVQVQVDGADLLIDWRETAGAQPIGPVESREGFGSLLLERAVARQLAGRFEREWTDQGLRVKIAVPLARVAI